MSGGNTGVKNLRAMFENKNTDLSTSPPSRGRSPSASISSVNSRPVSKVRASFVAVERPSDSGQPSQWGLRKTSDVSSMAEVREEVLIEEEAYTSRAGRNDLGLILKGSSFEDSTDKSGGARKEVAAKKENAISVISNGSTNTIGSSSNKIQEKKDKPDTNVAKSTKIAAKPPASLPTSIDTKNLSSKSKDIPSPAKKSPVLQKKSPDSTADGAKSTPESAGTTSIKPRGGVSKIQAVAASAQKAKEDRARSAQQQSQPQPQPSTESTKEVKPPSVALKQTAASKAHAQKTDAGQSGEIAAQLKQPSTKPTRLPTTATTTTTPSIARRDKEDPKSTNADRRATLTHAPRVANISTKATMAKKASRASLAATEDRSKSRQSTTYRPADESFLARMTRPTASSAQKAHAKVEVTTPPRPRQSSASNIAAKKLATKNDSKEQTDTARSTSAHEDESVLTAHESANAQNPEDQKAGNAIATAQQEATLQQQIQT